MPNLEKDRSVTWRFTLEWEESDEPWPDFPKQYTSQIMRPTHISWTMIDGKMGRCVLSGDNVKKDGTTGRQGIYENFYFDKDIPLWVWSLMDEAMEGLDLDA